MVNSKLSNSIWCYSLYGNCYEKYYQPLLKNIEISKDVGASIYIHTNIIYEKSVKDFFSDFLDDIDIIVHTQNYSINYPKILRFLTSNYVENNFYFFKDSDSIITQKEINIMTQWIKSNISTELIIRDNPLHIAPIMAGMFGVNNQTSRIIAKSVEKYFITSDSIFTNTYSYDQDWLASKIYPIVIKSAAVNTSYFYYSGENITRIEREPPGNSFIGAQAYMSYTNINDNKNQYLMLYGNDLLFLPYYSKISFLYGKVRPTIFLAFVFRILKKLIS